MAELMTQEVIDDFFNIYVTNMLDSNVSFLIVQRGLYDQIVDRMKVETVVKFLRNRYLFDADIDTNFDTIDSIIDMLKEILPLQYLDDPDFQRLIRVYLMSTESTDVLMAPAGTVNTVNFASINMYIYMIIWYLTTGNRPTLEYEILEYTSKSLYYKTFILYRDRNDAYESMLIQATQSILFIESPREFKVEGLTAKVKQVYIPYGVQSIIKSPVDEPELYVTVVGTTNANCMVEGVEIASSV